MRSAASSTINRNEDARPQKKWPRDFVHGAKREELSWYVKTAALDQVVASRQAASVQAQLSRVQTRSWAARRPTFFRFPAVLPCERRPDHVLLTLSVVVRNGEPLRSAKMWGAGQPMIEF